MNSMGRALITVGIGVLIGVAVARITVGMASQQPVVSAKDGQLLTFEHSSGRQLRIGTAGFDSPFVHFIEPNGTVVMELMTTPTGHSLFSIKNPQTGDPAIRIDTATPTGAARIVFFDPATGKPARTITFDSE